MQILTAQIGDRLVIGDVTIAVLEKRARGIKCGIDAPKDVPVHRKEVRDRIRVDQQTTPAPGK